MTLAERILNYRANHHLTQKQMASILGESAMMIYRIECGRYRTHKVNEVRIFNKLNELEAKENV